MAITGTVERGSIVWCQLHPAKGREQHGYRASIVISDGFIDPSLNKLAVTVPVTTQSMGHSFEIPVPPGIETPDSILLPPHLRFPELEGVVLVNNIRSIDLDARNAFVIGKVDPYSVFFEEIIDNVMGIVAYPEDDEYYS
ncbi:type II toxin-antitoxin system PemK/MazF family toxin [Paenibacillaceae bacterium WGS1546]|uniref:type II toxin-antitoxin system PemK/MazF family toxin n=1 Tax=Cohnella sp. WGS1546 TaxID=3366810 RepID=UPI00372D5CA0